MDIIGREAEIKRLNRVMEEKDAQLVVVYGRRRVGKTYLINEYFGNSFTFKFTGAFNSTKREQLNNFQMEIERTSNIKKSALKNWSEAFFVLRDYLEKLDDKEKQIVFFDEMPWMDTRSSGFLKAFEWFWNSWGSSRKNLVFIVCGSATSWLVEKFDRNKGGLFNRRTCRLYLQPFNLHDTEAFLASRNINWSRYDITQCYMIMGGIPYYLKLLDRESSLNENIDAIFFKKRGELWDEFYQLFMTLFSNNEAYIRIVEALSKKRSGLTWTDISQVVKMPANGVLTRMLNDLIGSGFVRANDEFGYKNKEKTYQLSDYFTMFYFRFMKEYAGKDEHFWSNTNDNPSRRVWSGLTYEQVCKDHVSQIKQKLGISGVMTEISSWSQKGQGDEKGAQIDLLIDRRDGTINLCEIKFATTEYRIDKEYDEVLKNKAEVFRKTTGTRKTLQMTLITTYGLEKNKYSNYIGKVISMDDLFEKAEY